MKKIWARARVLDASDRSYADAVLPLLEKARKEIVLSLYLIEPLDSAPPLHPVNRFFEALLAAQSRGVKIKFLLNTNFRFKPKTEVGEGAYFQKLLLGGAELTSLLPTKRLHDKLIVIDRRFVIEGSMNWSVAALMTNYESASVIDSPAHAKKKLERIEKLMVPVSPGERTTDRLLLPIPPSIEFPLELFQKRYLGKMVSASDSRGFDLYLILLGQAAAARKTEFELDLETVGSILKFPPTWRRTALRRQMIKVLRKLEDEYGLIEAEFPYARNAGIRLKELPGPKVPIAGWILEPSYVGGESSGVVFLELAREVLKQEGLDITQLSAPQLEARFGVGRSTLVRARRERAASAAAKPS